MSRLCTDATEVKKLLAIAIAVLLLATGTGHAENGPWKSEPPPPEFDRPFAGRLEIIEMADPCGDGNPLKMACTKGREDDENGGGRMGPGKCIISIAKRRVIEAMGMTVDEILRHEIAHCNGWRH